MSRNKMPASERAKQFMPFSALKGLPEALARAEREVEQEKAMETKGDADMEYKEYLAHNEND